MNRADSSTSPLSVDISPCRVVRGLVDGDPEDMTIAAAQDLTSRLRETLATAGILAAVDAVPDRAPGDAVAFALACDASGRILHVDADGHVITGKSVEHVEADLQTVLGNDVDLWVDPEHDLKDDDSGATCPLDGDGAAWDGDERGAVNHWGEHSESGRYIAEDQRFPDLDTAASDFSGIDSGEQDHLGPEDEPDDDGGFEADRVLHFSRRCPTAGLLMAWLLQTQEVEAGVLDTWSVFRFTDQNGESDVLDAERRERPSILIRRGVENPDEWVSAYVQTTARRKHEGYWIDLAAAATMKAVQDPSLLDPEAQMLLSVLVNEHLLCTAELQELMNDPTLNVDGMRMVQALAPNFASPMSTRIEEFLLSMGLPAGLVTPAVSGDRLPAPRVYTRHPLWKNLKQAMIDGHAGMDPVGSRRGWFRRWEETRVRHPRLTLVLSGGEFLLGATMMATTWPVGGWKTAVTVAGTLLVIEAVADTLLTRARVRRKRAPRAGRDVPSSCPRPSN